MNHSEAHKIRMKLLRGESVTAEEYKDFYIFTARLHHAKYEELLDALAFESRVVEKLLQTPKNIGAGCPFGELCICEGDGVFLGCQGSRLKWARLAVEAEMDKE